LDWVNSFTLGDAGRVASGVTVYGMLDLRHVTFQAVMTYPSDVSVIRLRWWYRTDSLDAKYACDMFV